MKKILVLGSKDSGVKNDPVVIANSIAKQSNISATVVYFEDLLFEISKQKQSITDTKSGQNIADTDLLVAINWYKNGRRSFYRDVAYTLALYLDANNTPFWNEEMLMQRSTTKLSAAMQLALLGLDIPHTFFSINPELIFEQKTNFPAIFKNISASRGRSNYLINDSSELSKYLEQPNRFILQEYIPNSADFRVICYDRQPRIVIKRQRDGGSTHLNNTSLGAKASLVDLSQLDRNTLKDCQRICEVMGRNICGIDFIEANGGLSRKVYLEVNAIPQLTSGTHVTKKMSELSIAVEDYLKG